MARSHRMCFKQPKHPGCLRLAAPAACAFKPGHDLARVFRRAMGGVSWFLSGLSLLLSGLSNGG